MGARENDMRGIEVREGKSGGAIRIKFMYKGVECRETLRLEPTKSNLRFAQRKRGEILNAITLGKFNYAEHFPESANLVKFGFASIKAVLLGELMDKQLAIAERNLSPSTYRGYLKSYNAHLKERWAMVAAKEVRPSAVAEWISDNFTCKVKTIRNHLTILHSAFNQAVNDELIPFNPIERVDIDKCVRQEQKHSDFVPDPYSMEEIKALLETCNLDESPLWKFAFSTGMRTSEIIGLQWDDIDLVKMKIHVRRARVVGILKNFTKTEAGKRSIDIRNAAHEAIMVQREKTLLAGGYVFLDDRTGNPWADDSALKKRWMRISRWAKVTYRNPYQTRHTFASAMLAAGQPPLYVAKQMGHKGTTMINRTYGRWIEQGSSPETQIELAEFFAQISPKKSGKIESGFAVKALR